LTVEYIIAHDVNLLYGRVVAAFLDFGAYYLVIKVIAWITKKKWPACSIAVFISLFLLTAHLLTKSLSPFLGK